MATEFTALNVRILGDIRDLTGKMRVVTGDIKSFATKNGAALRSIGMISGIMGAAIVAGFGSAVKAAANFDKAITNAASVTGKTGEALKVAKGEMEDLAKTLGETTVFSARQAAEAMYDLASKGFDPARMSIAELQPFLDLAAATQSELAQTTQTVTATIRAFGLQTSDSSRVADVFAKAIGSSAATLEKLQLSMTYVAPIAKTANQSLEGTAAVLGKIYDLGFPASAAGTALRKTFATLLTPSEKLTEFLDKMGLTMADVDLRSHSFSDILATLDKTSQNLGEDFDLASEVMTLFGLRAGPVVNALLETNAAGEKAYDTIGDLTTVLKEAGGTAKQMAETQLDTLPGQLTLLNSAIEGLRITIGEMFTPMLKDMATSMANVVRGVTAWVKEHPALTKAIVSIITILGGLGLALGATMFFLGPLASAMEGVAIAASHAATNMLMEAKAAQYLSGTNVQLMGTTKALGLSTKALSVLYSVGLAIAITYIVIQLKNLAMAYIDLKSAQAQQAEAENRMFGITYSNAENISNQLNKLVETYTALSTAERENLKVLNDRAKALADAARQLEENNALSEQQKERARELLREKLLALAEEKNATIEALDLNKRMTVSQLETIEADEAEIKIKRTKKQLMEELTTKQRELNAQLASDEISKETYAKKWNALRLSMIGLLGTADEVLAAMNKLDESDPHIEIKMEIFGADDLLSIQDRIRRVNNDIVLEGLEGTERQIQAERFRLQERLLGIKREMEELEKKNKAIMAGIERDLLMTLAAEKAKAKAAGDGWEERFENAEKWVQEEYNLKVQAQEKYYTALFQAYELDATRSTELSNKKIANMEKEESKSDATHSKRLEQAEAEADVMTRLVSMERRPSGGGGMMAGGGGGGGGIFDTGFQGLGEVGKTIGQGAQQVYRTLTDYSKKTTKVVDTVVRATTQALGTLVSYGVSAGGRFEGMMGEMPTGMPTLSSVAYDTAWSRAKAAGSYSVPQTDWYKLHRGESVSSVGKPTEDKLVIINVIKESDIPSIMAKYPNAIVNPVLRSIQTNPVVRKILKGAVGR